MKQKKMIVQIDPETNNAIKSFKTVAEAAKELKIDHGSINKALKGDRKTAGGFMWSIDTGAGIEGDKTTGTSDPQKLINAMEVAANALQDITGQNVTLTINEPEEVPTQIHRLEPYQGSNDNILVIGDLHEPFCLPKYLSFCREQQEKFNCGRVVFIGDVIDNHYSSYHETDPDGMAAGQELDLAINKLSHWHYTFPSADVLIGNHDRMAYRKATTAGISRKWVRNFNEVLQTPGWNFIEEIEYFDINFNHGEGGTAKTKMKDELQSQVQGHMHTQAYVDWAVGSKYRIFGMQVGSGVDRDAYALAYAKRFKRQVISCGVILDKGTLPIVIPMEL